MAHWHARVELNNEGPWHPAADVLLSLLPIAVLVCTTLVQRIKLPAAQSLPLSALLLYLMRCVYFSHPPNFLNASIVQSLNALTPISIAAGAISLFAVMDATLCTPYIIEKIKFLCNAHPVAEVFIIGWAFVFILEGAAGFGTPPALSAPVLVALGHPPINTIVCVLLMDTLATPFGAVGTPLWFGLDGVFDDAIEEKELLNVSYKTGVLCFLCALIIPVLAASFLVPLRELRRCALFVALSITSTAGVMLGVSFGNYEFPALVGGLAGMVITGACAYVGIGLSGQSKHPSSGSRPGLYKKHKQTKRTSSSLHTNATADDTNSLHDSDVSIKNAHDTGNARSEHDGDGDAAAAGADDDGEGDDDDSSSGPQAQSTTLAIGGGEYKKHMKVRSTPFLMELHNQGVLPGQKSDRDVPGFEEDVRASFAAHLEELSKRAAANPLHNPPAVAFSHGDDPEDPDAIEPHNLLNGSKQHWLKVAVARTLPLALTVLILIVTRAVDAISREVIQREEPAWRPQLGTLGEFQLSSGLIIGLNSIFREDGMSDDPDRGAINWSYQTLYVPFILPFVVANAITVAWLRHDLQVPVSNILSNIKQRVGSVVIPLFGSLAFVSLLSNGGTAAPAAIIGNRLAQGLQEGYIVIVSYLAALGSFFSGSTTVSNLTFAPVHLSAARELGWAVEDDYKGLTTLLALQNVGATMGNAITFANIVRTCCDHGSVACVLF